MPHRRRSHSCHAPAPSAPRRPRVTHAPRTVSARTCLEHTAAPTDTGAEETASRPTSVEQTGHARRRPRTRAAADAPHVRRADHSHARWRPRVWAPRSSVYRRITMTFRAISTTRRRLHHPAVQSISLVTQPAPLRCALRPLNAPASAPTRASTRPPIRAPRSCPDGRRGDRPPSVSHNARAGDGGERTSEGPDPWPPARVSAVSHDARAGR